MSLKITVNNEEVVCNNNISIKEEMLSTSSTILKNCYPKTWELDKDYVSRYYFPKDYSKCKITDDVYHPEVIGTRVSGTNFTINYDNTLNWNLEEIKGDTKQENTPTPDTPVEIQSVTGLQNVEVCGKNLLNIPNGTYSHNGITAVSSNGIITLNGTASATSFIGINVGLNLSSGTYSLSLNNSDTKSDTGTYVRFDNDAGSVLAYVNTNASRNIVLSSSTTYGQLVIRTTSGISFENFIIKPQLEQGSTATEYEPYKGNTYEVNLGKNLLNNTATTQTINGITYTINEDKSITANGTATAHSVLNLYGNLTLSAGTYTFSGCPSNGSWGTYSMGFGSYNDSGNGVTFTKTEDYTGQPYIRIANGITVNNLVFKPMIEKGQATSYSPYFTPIELNKIGNYQDRIYKDNGTWYIEKQVSVRTLNGTENWSYSSNKRTYWLELSDIKVQNIQSNMMDIASNLNNYGTILNNDSALSIEYGFFVNNQYIHIRNKNILNNINNFKTWLASNQVKVLIPLKETTTTEITDETLLSQLENIYNMSLLNGINNITITSENLPMIMQLYYNYKEAYTSEDLLFCGCVKNTGNISLNPRDPHYVDLQVLDFKTLLSEGETLNYVITGKTIVEAINQVVNSISDYGFVVGNIQILNPNDIINAYSTLNKTAYDVFQYIADITQSRWTTRMIDENTIAIDFYDPTLMPTASPIQSTQAYYENNQIVDISFNYTTNDYRNKQIMTSDEVYANITQTETIIADGYTQNFMCQNKLGIIETITLNGVSKTIATKSEQELGITADFYYQPGDTTFTSSNTISSGSVIVITYYPIVKGREIILNTGESTRIETQIGRKGTLSRYENRNDTTSSQELQKIGQSYIKYKGQAEINLKVKTRIDLFNVGQIVEYQAPLEELSTDYMVKSKEVDWYAASDETFYIYELTSNFNYENAVNYFDNQRAKNQGNIGDGETITRNIDLTNDALILFYDTNVEEIQVQNPTSLDFALDGVLI